VTLATGAAERMLARFSGRLHTVTLTRQPESAYDLSDPAAAPTGTPTSYSCQGLAFTYEQRDIDGSRIMKGDYRVLVLRGSLSTVPMNGDSISVPPPGETVAKSGRVVAVEAVTEAFVTVQVRGVPSVSDFDGGLEVPLP
jgi:hypothetical protein